MEWLFVFRIAILITIDAAALFGNSLVCISVYRNHRLRDKIGTVILALAVTDLLTSTIVVPLTTASLILGKNNINLKPKWVSNNESDFWCGIQGFLVYGLNAMSLFSMAMAAFIRFLCVVKPNVYRRYVKTKSIILVLAMVAVAIIIVQSSLAIPGYGQYEFIWKFALCMFLLQGKYKPFRRVFEIAFTVIFFALPLVIIFVCYTAIFVTVRKHNRRVHIQKSTSVQSIGQTLRTRWYTTFLFGSRKSRKQSSIETRASVKNLEQNESKREEVIATKESSTDITDTSLKDNSQDKAENYKLLQSDDCLFPKRRKVDKINCTWTENIKESNSTADNQLDDKLNATKESIPLTVFRASRSKGTDAETRNVNSNGTDQSVLHTDQIIDNHVTCAKSKFQDSTAISNLEASKHAYNLHGHSSKKKHDAEPHITPETPNIVPISSRISDQPVQAKPAVVKGQVTEAKVTKTVLAVFIGFICCWIPAALFFAITPYTEYHKSAPYAVLIPICGAMSSAINPFIYGAADRRFRQTYRKGVKISEITHRKIN